MSVNNSLIMKETYKFKTAFKTQRLKMRKNLYLKEFEFPKPMLKLVLKHNWQLKSCKTIYPIRQFNHWNDYMNMLYFFNQSATTRTNFIIKTNKHGVCVAISKLLIIWLVSIISIEISEILTDINRCMKSTK